MLETQRSFVNSWECDENVHMNIQFYWKRLADAAQIFFQLSGAPRQQWRDRHVRYHGELMMGTNTIVQSARLPESNQLVHHLVNGSSGELSATAIDQYTDLIGGDGPRLAEVPELARPRSLPVHTLQPIETHRVIDGGSGLVSHRSVLTPQECDHHGVLLDQFQIARFSDAASHLWHHLGVSRRWMHDNGLGSVAVEMKASRHAPPRVGMMIEVVTWMEELRSKTFSFAIRSATCRPAPHSTAAPSPRC